MAARAVLVLSLLAAAGCGSSKRSQPGTAAADAAGAGGSSNAGNGQAGTPASGSGGSSGAAAAQGFAGFGGLVSSGGVTSAGGRATGSAGRDSSGGQPNGGQGAGGVTPNAGTGGGTTVSSALVTSSNGTWTTATWTETSNATVDVTVDDTASAQTWEGFGGTFHELGWNQLATPALEDEALSLLFGADGARLALARIPIGASDYALDRYTLDDTGTDVIPDATESNRPAPDLALSHFSIERDKQTLIPAIKGALAKNPHIRVFAVPYTPPVWMKTGYKKSSGADPDAPAVKPSYFDGGTMKTDAVTLNAYAQYLVEFIKAYGGEGIAIDTIAFQQEPTFDQNYPSCVWAKTTYATYVSNYLGPALASANLDTKLMLGTLAADPADTELMTAVMSDSKSTPYVSAVGVQWGVLSRVQTTPLTYAVPVWATEHKCGNYPFVPSAQTATATTPPIAGYTEPPPNDQAYAVESWWYIRDAITKGKVTAYNLPHLLLDAVGKGNDTSRQWAQDSLLVVNEGTLTQTQTYYVVRHFSQFVDPGAKVVGTSGGDAVAFKNPDGSLVAVVYSAAAKSNYTVAIGGKELQFSIPASGWATVKYVP